MVFDGIYYKLWCLNLHLAHIKDATVTNQTEVALTGMHADQGLSMTHYSLVQS